MMKNISQITLFLACVCIPAHGKPDFEAPVRIEADGKPLTIPHGYAFPSFVDLDKDGLRDLVVGEHRDGGQMLFHKNTGTKKAPEYAKAKFLMVKGKRLTVPGIG